ADLRDGRLAAHFRPVVELRTDLHVLKRGGKDRAFDQQHAAGFAQRVLEVAGDAAHRQYEQVAERVATERRSLAEAVLEEPLHQRLHFRQRDDIVAEVAWWQDAVLTSKATRRSAVVADGHDGRDIRRVELQAAEHSRHA